ncbi:MAG TPA: SRPBCC family protein [Thermoplasmata archaeon]|jgi:activator of HSP90 ATPase|nr:SRPBCC family protein [Thermoplasmata archaeon]
MTWGSVHQEVQFAATPKQVYDALMVSREHAKFTGVPAKISPVEGGEFHCFDGSIEGRNVSLIPGQRIVQAWRISEWEDGVYSIVRFELEKTKGGTKLVFDHTGVPEDALEGITQGWFDHYWDNLTKYFAGPKR